MTLNLLLKFFMTNLRMSPGLDELFMEIFVEPELAEHKLEKLARRSPAILMSSSIVCFFSFDTPLSKLCAAVVVGDRSLFRLVDRFESKLWWCSSAWLNFTSDSLDIDEHFFQRFVFNKIHFRCQLELLNHLTKYWRNFILHAYNITPRSKDTFYTNMVVCS